METSLTAPNVGDHRVIGLSITPTLVRGVSIVSTDPPSVHAVAESDVSTAADTSIAVAEVHAALLDDQSVVPVAVAAEFDDGGIGPAEEVEETAQRLADDNDRPIRWTTDGDLGVLADAGEVDRLASVLAGTGVPVSRIELAEGAAQRCRNGGRMGAIVDRLPVASGLRNVEVSSALLRAPGLAGPEDLAPAIGAALGALSEAAGDLREPDANTASPNTDPGAVAGWTVQPTRAPVDFAAPPLESDGRLQLAVVGLLVLSALLLAVLIVF